MPAAFCISVAEMSRMSGIWRRIMGFERMLRDLWVAPPGGDWGDTWVAPPGGYLRYLGPSPLTAAQGVLHFFRHPFLICSSCLRIYKHFSWPAIAVGHQNLLCHQHWNTFKRFKKLGLRINSQYLMTILGVTKILHWHTETRPERSHKEFNGQWTHIKPVLIQCVKFLVHIVWC